LFVFAIGLILVLVKHLEEEGKNEEE